MLTEPGDVVLDIFAGSNTTGQVAEAEGRQWLSFELSRAYVAASAFRFLTKGTAPAEMRELHIRIGNGEMVDLGSYLVQKTLLANVG